MGADGYFSWEESTTTVPICTLCGWRGTPVVGAHDSQAVRRAFYAHFHASCIINAAAGSYDDDEEIEFASVAPVAKRALAALAVLEGLSVRCPTCEARNGWCEHRQPPFPDETTLYSWAQPVPDWVL